MLFAPHLSRCFGRGDEYYRHDCPCPPSCRELCRRIRFDRKRSPRFESGRGKHRPYTPIPSDILGVWGPPDQPEPSDGVKLTFVFLVSRTLKTRPRWAVESIADLAHKRGVSVKTFRQHCAALKGLGFITTIPYRLLSEHQNMNEHAILLLDLPGWYQTPRDLAGPEPDEDDEEEDDDDDPFNIFDDDIGAFEATDHRDRPLTSNARSRPRRRGVDLDKVRRQRVALHRRESSDVE